MKIKVGNSDKKYLLLEGTKVGSEISLLVFQSEFPSDVGSVRFDCVLRKMEQNRYLLRSPSVSDKISTLYFCGSKMQILG